jgi:myo-inositol 2-dehydrogenase/D-chiro-inositol 1-dehydrogenase
MATTHLQGWLDLGAEVSIYSLEGAEALAASVPGDRVRAVGTFDELLGHVGVVDVCTPTYTHKELALAAVASGHDVVCEKPLALGAADAEEMRAAAEAAGVQLFPGHVVRFFPDYHAMVVAVAAGAIGAPAALRFHRIGSYPIRSIWFSEPEHSGGILMDQMIHDFDMARLVAGEVVRVYARETGDLVPPVGPAPVAAATAVLTHESGAITTVRGVWGPQGTPFQTNFRIAGPGGVLEHDSEATNAFKVIAQTRDDAGIMPDVALVENPYHREIAELAAAFRGGVSRVTAADGVAAVAIAEAALRSVATGEPVDVAEQGVAR